MPEPTAADRELAGAFKALGHPVRVALLHRLLNGEPCVSDLHECLGQSQPSISQHLGVLRDRGLIVPQRRGNRTCFQASDDRLRDLLNLARDILANPTAAKGSE
jgi:ArsR family transcriptional regulator